MKQEIVDSSENFETNVLIISGVNPMSEFPVTPYISLAENDIPRIAFAPVPSNIGELVHANAAKYASLLVDIMSDVADCGCNAIITGGTFEQMSAHIDAVSNLANGIYPINPLEAGAEDSADSGVIKPPVIVGGPVLGVILNPVWLNENVEHCIRIVSRYRANKFVKGWMVMDQPHHQDWGDVLETDGQDTEYNSLTLAYKTAVMYSRYFKFTLPDGKTEKAQVEQMTMFNLPASELPLWIGSCKDYPQYLEALDTLFHPAVWSYNYFPFLYDLTSMIKDDKPSVITTYHETFYRFLSYFSSISNASSRPFWAYCQTEEYQVFNRTDNKLLFWYPTPTIGMLRFEAFSALAYGAQGLVFARLGMETSKEGEVRVERLNAPLVCNIAPESEKVTLEHTGIYESLKQLNKEIKQCADVFSEAKCKAIGHVKNLFSQPEAKFPFGCVGDMTCSGLGSLVSNLEKGEEKFIVIVNHDAFNAQNFKVNLIREARVLFPVQSDSSVSGEYNFTLAPGGMLIFGWN